MYIDVTWIILTGLLSAFFYQLYKIHQGVKAYRNRKRKA